MSSLSLESTCHVLPTDVRDPALWSRELFMNLHVCTMSALLGTSKVGFETLRHFMRFQLLAIRECDLHCSNKPCK